MISVFHDSDVDRGFGDQATLYAHARPTLEVGCPFPFFGSYASELRGHCGCTYAHLHRQFRSRVRAVCLPAVFLTTGLRAEQVYVVCVRRRRAKQQLMVGCSGRAK